MNIHEFQAKEVLARYGVPTLRRAVATTAAEAGAATAQIDPSGAGPWVVKAQIHAGGRGKGGGVKLVKSAAEAESFAGSILGKPLVTHQTGPQGRIVRRVLVEQGCRIERELYLGLTLDRATGVVTAIASAEGGVEIEEVAAHSPEKILREAIAPEFGCQAYQGRKLAKSLGLPSASLNKFAKFLCALYDAYVATDASLVEINPLVLTKDGDLIALDAKMGFDDNALFRHADIRELRDPEEEDPRERQAQEFDLSYIALDGTIGCMVNGAGLAMATMDIIKHAGGEPANFLDVGGGADAKKVAAAFRIILADPSVKAVLINIFGGIMRCDVLATGVVQAATEMKLTVPVVCRLEGTNVEIGRKILADSGLNIITAADMADAAQKVVAASTGSAR
ncbi:MAG: ADP-forming succinate--CoA ligase subunit beta [Deltaproteobacteria bacterium]|nr:ADP-forming succinate--CoA ligase subunit beta [Deltaproteobacteria bacterium]